MKNPIIQTPRGRINLDPTGRAQLVWSFDFGSKWQTRFSKAQVFVDSEILRLSEPYTPLLTGTLIKSGQLGTEIGSGLVQWIAPYAKARYYSPRKPGSKTGKLRGSFWFERMKQVRGKQIIAGVKRLAGGGS